MHPTKAKATSTVWTNVQEPGSEPRAITRASWQSLRIAILVRRQPTLGRKGSEESNRNTGLNRHVGALRKINGPAAFRGRSIALCGRQLRQLTTVGSRGCPIAND